MTDPVVCAGDAGAQSQNLEAPPAHTGINSEPGSAEARGEGKPAPLPTEGPSVDGTQKVAALRERLRIMFIEGEECPRPSGLGRCADAATGEWAVAARDAVAAEDVGFWKVFGDDVN